MAERTEPFCYVAMPFGEKPSNSGVTVDFDAVYDELIKPAMDEVGLRCVRADEFGVGSIVQTEVFRALISADLMIADITTLDSNVLYELGVRHGATAKPALVVRASGEHVPFDLSITRTLEYHLSQEGGPNSKADEFRRKLANTAQAELAGETTNAVYASVPEIEPPVPVAWVRPPTWRKDAGSERAAAQSKIQELKTFTSTEELSEKLRSVESEIEGAIVSPEGVMGMVEAHRLASDWDGLIAFIKKLDKELRESNPVAQELALAYSRRGGDGDIDRAIEVARRVVDRSEDVEALNVLGRLYVDSGRFDEAVESYRRAFTLGGTAVHSGQQLAALLYRQRGPGDPELIALIPQVRAAITGENRELPAESWGMLALTGDLELAVMAGEWEDAGMRADLMTQQYRGGLFQFLRRPLMRTTITALEPLGAPLTGRNSEKFNAVLAVLEESLETSSA